MPCPSATPAEKYKRCCGGRARWNDDHRPFLVVRLCGLDQFHASLVSKLYD
jgi:hypothetical protein